MKEFNAAIETTILDRPFSILGNIVNFHAWEHCEREEVNVSNSLKNIHLEKYYPYLY